MKKRASIHDIAKALDISATTISFVLNGKAVEKRISKTLTQKVLDYVEEIGYQRNMVAKSLRTGKTNIIAMLVEDISDPFFSSIARIIEESAYLLDYKVFFASTENDTQKTQALIRLFRERQVDAYIIAPPPGIEAELQWLINDKIPVILFDRYVPGVNTTNILSDNFGGTYNGAMHLLEQGYRNIGFITLDSNQTQMTDRLKGYQHAIDVNGLTPYIAHIGFHEDEKDIHYQIRSFLRNYPQLDALFFATNYFAVSGIQVMHEDNMDIPNDIAILSFDDNLHYNMFSPAISAVSQPVKELSETIIKKLFQLLDDKGTIPEETIVLPTKLVVRKSSLAKEIA